MKTISFLFFFGIFLLPAYSQNTASSAARLQVYATKPDGSKALMTSDALSVGYDQLKLTGEVLLNTFMTEDADLRQLLDSALYDRITFSGQIPEGQFAFQSMVNAKFSVETDLFFGDQQGRVLLDFDVSNRNTSLANSFVITCMGDISLADDLGITRDLGIADQLSYQFMQTVTVKNY